MRITILLLLTPLLFWAQKKQAVYKKLATHTCDCVSKKKDVTDVNLGICIFEAIDLLSNKERKSIDVNPDDKMTSIQNIAESVGIEMAVICPDVFIKIAENKADANFSDEDELDLFYVGTFESMTAKEFNTIVLLDEQNQKQEFVWLFSFDGDNLFIKNKIVKGDKLEIHYRQQDFFDPKLNQYRIYNEIVSIKLL
ncbi:hypothetical protein EZL74_01355 [Flavobacterium silvisoli]|uniref:Uncharacterized protein n=1 Tax=Flavobacterium silvisoli TaxID=2529433 RepID=A0A4Q9ZAE0_9FLAO|nr:hypothetical protein [Flavobacterium silvisoli]TBX71179.1 hypothetical protein EZL74_01355 [Flavobacterium silvisoli]